MSDVLSEIIATKRIEVEHSRAVCALTEQYAMASQQTKPRGFAAALRTMAARGEIAVIAEIKKASPSRGLLRESFEPAQIALAYQRASACCLSVLTDRHYFMGADEHLVAARNAVDLPVLRKDFIIDPYQVVQSRALGADCILLIAAALTPDQMKELAQCAFALGLDVLVEVHNEHELDQALAIEHALIGINNRDLRTFNTDVEVSQRLASLIPKDRFLVSESGISSRAEIDLLRDCGIGAFLIGEALMRAPDPGAALTLLIAP
jgi:indole-3-glycerol phosphate synthase